MVADDRLALALQALQSSPGQLAAETSCKAPEEKEEAFLYILGPDETEPQGSVLSCILYHHHHFLHELDPVVDIQLAVDVLEVVFQCVGTD